MARRSTIRRAAGNGGATTGSLAAKLKTEDKIFESFPPALRACIANLSVNIAMSGMKPLLRKYGESTLIESLQDWDRRRIAENALAFYGPTHPQARKDP